MRILVLLSIIIFNTIVTAQNLILDGQTIPLDSASSISIDPTTGNITATSDNGSLTCSEVGFPPTLTLSANPTTVNSGDSSLLSWTVNNNATSCTKSGAWNGSLTTAQMTNGAHSVTVNNITTNSNYNLICTNNFGSSPLRTASVTINGGNPNCTSQPPILNGAEDFTIRLIPGATGNSNGTPSNPATYSGDYDEIAAGTGWPGGVGGQSFATLSKNKYIAMRFTTDNTNAISKLSITPSGNGQGPGSQATTISISECPGDFTTHVNQSRCLAVGGGIPNIRWSQNPATTSTFHCLLDKNKTYYFNIVHSNDVNNDYELSGCQSSFCGIIFAQADES